MTDLVFVQGNQPVTTSLIIAEGTDNQHESIMRLLRDNAAHLLAGVKLSFPI